MAEVLNLNPTVANYAQPLGTVARDVLGGSFPVLQDSLVAEHETPGVIDTALAMWRRETVLGAAMNSTKFRAGEGNVLEWDNAFNPYGFYAANEKEFKDIEPFVRQGGFDHIYSETQFRVLGEQVRREMKDIKTLENGSTAGEALGMGLSLLDVASLIPFAGAAKEASLLRNVARVGASGAAVGSAQELALHEYEATRTTRESFLNIGLTSALGGGIGALSSVLHPASKLNPANGAKALDPNIKHETGVILPGEAPADGDVIKTGSVGAARVTGEDTKLAGADSWLAKLTAPFRRVTPVGRSFLWTDPLAREVTQGLADVGGALSKHAEDGVAMGASAEDLLRDHMLTYGQAVQVKHDAWFQLNKELGGAQSKFAAAAKQDAALLSGGLYKGNTLEETEFEQIVYKKLTSGAWQDGFPLHADKLDSEWVARLLDSRGLREHYDVVDKWTDVAAKEVQRGLLEQEDKMVKFGLITEDQRLGKKYGVAQLWNKNGIVMQHNEAKAFFLDVFSKRPATEWLAENHGMKLEDFDKLPVTDKKRAEILQEWNGDLEATTKAKAEARLKAAEQALQDRALETQEVLRGLRVSLGENAKATVTELKQSLKVARQAHDLERLQVHAERVALDEMRVERLTDMYARTGNLDAKSLLDEATGALRDSRAAYETANTMRLDGAARAKVEARAKEAVSKLAPEDFGAHMDRRATDVQNVADRLEAIETKLADAQKARAGAAAELKEIRQGAKFAKADLRAAEKEANAATKGAAKAAKIAPMTDYVDKLVSDITDMGKAPLGILQNTVGESGRTLDRRIILTAAERRAAEELNLLHTDLMYVLERGYNDISARLALTEKFGEQSLEDTIRKVEANYDALIAKAKDAKQVTRLTAEREGAKKDITGLRDRLLGRARFPDDPESMVTWGLGKLRQWTFLRFVAGFPLSSLTDLASQHLHVGLGSKSLTAAKEAFNILRAANVDPQSREFQLFVRAGEMLMAHSTTARRFGVDDMQHSLGIGTTGTKLQKTTGAVDKFSNALVSRANVWSGQAAWTEMGKAMAGIVQMDNIRTAVGKYDKLPKLERAKLAAIGIGESEAKRLDKFMQKYGVDIEGKFFDPNAFNWHKDEGGRDRGAPHAPDRDPPHDGPRRDDAGVRRRAPVHVERAREAPASVPVVRLRHGQPAARAVRATSLHVRGRAGRADLRAALRDRDVHHRRQGVPERQEPRGLHGDAVDQGRARPLGRDGVPIAVRRRSAQGDRAQRVRPVLALPQQPLVAILHGTLGTNSRLRAVYRGLRVERAVRRQGPREGDPPRAVQSVVSRRARNRRRHAVVPRGRARDFGSSLPRGRPPLFQPVHAT
jgi:hypothetical protein